jgi:hypothetical protein
VTRAGGGPAVDLQRCASAGTILLWLSLPSALGFVRPLDNRVHGASMTPSGAPRTTEASLTRPKVRPLRVWGDRATPEGRVGDITWRPAGPLEFTLAAVRKAMSIVLVSMLTSVPYALAASVRTLGKAQEPWRLACQVLMMVMLFPAQDPALSGTKVDPKYQKCLSTCMYYCTKPKGEGTKLRTECLPECKESCATTKEQKLLGLPKAAGKEATGTSP